MGEQRGVRLRGTAADVELPWGDRDAELQHGGPDREHRLERGIPTTGNCRSTLTYTRTRRGKAAYTATAWKVSYNNGQISQMTDSISGETTVYQYDALKRLTSASNSASNETLSYDGFGNLTGKRLNGTLQSIPVNPTTNRLSGPTYDLNGDMTVGAGATMTYNEDNRMSSALEPSGSLEYYYYTPDGKRFCRSMAIGDTEYMLLWGLWGSCWARIPLRATLPTRRCRYSLREGGCGRVRPIVRRMDRRGRCSRTGWARTGTPGITTRTEMRRELRRRIRWGLPRIRRIVIRASIMPIRVMFDSKDGRFKYGGSVHGQRGSA